MWTRVQRRQLECMCFDSAANVLGQFGGDVGRYILGGRIEGHEKAGLLRIESD